MTDWLSKDNLPPELNNWLQSLDLTAFHAMYGPHHRSELNSIGAMCYSWLNQGHKWGCNQRLQICLLLMAPIDYLMLIEGLTEGSIENVI